MIDSNGWNLLNETYIFLFLLDRGNHTKMVQLLLNKDANTNNDENDKTVEGKIQIHDFVYSSCLSMVHFE